ncbi:MAG: asparagine synthase (glutamine-hydrolyzing) [Actinomyces sp.]|nr:MAG: asparagine synthase (glutamine-hydrolyzing) [Actinomyces sp.]
MCGIAGIRRLDGRPVDPADLEAMADQLVHRGPDDRGIWTSGSTGFAHTRLSIIDLEGSRQPMSTPDDAVTVCFNGEILNYAELRRRSDHPFRTHGDTEVLLARWLARGPQMVTELRGQFAFALHDARTGNLVVTRDRLGILPLYHVTTPEFFAFASEIKALLAVLSRVEVDVGALDAYLAHRSVPAPRTLFAGIAELPPGTLLTIAPDGTTDEQRWWEPRLQPDPDLDPDELVSTTAELLDAAVSEALVADVPVGAYLSGGVDSSLICALAARHSSHRLRTFSAGFDDPRVDELPHARRVSAHLGTDHHEVVLGASDFEGLWHRLTWHRDAPLSEPADMAVFRLAELARSEVKVVLSGEGSDELFGGYPKYRWARRVDTAARLLGPLSGPVLGGIGELLPARLGRARIALRAAAEPRAERARAWFAPFTSAERRHLLGQHHEPSSPPAPLTGDPVADLVLSDCGPWLSDNLLARGDRMSMAASLELRPPFLDPRLVDHALTVPSRLRTRRGRTKWAVKEVARRHLPAEIVDRRKVGFRVPLDAWFRSGLRTMAADLLLSPDSFAAEVFDRRAVSRLLEDHERGRRDEQIRLWTLLSLEVWHQRFFKGITA